MYPDLAPLILGSLFLMIPIVAIVVRSPIGKAFAAYLEGKAHSSRSHLDTLIQNEQMLLRHDERLNQLEKELKLLRESSQKYYKLLEEKEGPP